MREPNKWDVHSNIHTIAQGVNVQLYSIMMLSLFQSTQINGVFRIKNDHTSIHTKI